MAIRTKPKTKETRHSGIINGDQADQLEDLNSDASFEQFAIGGESASRARCHLRDRTTKTIWLSVEGGDRAAALEAALKKAPTMLGSRPATTAAKLMEENKELKERLAKQDDEIKKSRQGGKDKQ